VAAISLSEMKDYLNVDSDNTAHDGTITDLIAAAKSDLFTATGKTLDDDNPLVRQYIKLYSRREFDMLSDNSVDSRLLDIQRKILLSNRFEEAG
jgi:Txe/YoeB family toxin of Txe-Axe toxin-antitoxin module